MELKKLDKDSCNYLDVTRFIGLYLVILAHFMFPFQYLSIKGFAFSFHMPLFFIVSGILHKIQGFSWRGVLQLVLALIVPYLIYNTFGAVYLLAAGNSIDSLLPKIVSTLLVELPITSASWFLIVLFWLKFFALFLPGKRSLIGFSVLCVAILFVTDRFDLRFGFDNLFMLRGALISFPFFAFGYLIKNVLLLQMRLYQKLGLMLLLFAVNIGFLMHVGDISIGNLEYRSLHTMYPMAIAGSLGLIYFSQMIVPWVSFGFVKDISRGGMMIVGLHFFVMFSVFPYIFFGVTPFRYIILLSALLLFVFYIIIKLTYNRLPILYGKWRG